MSKPKKNPLFKGFPKRLKDPKCFEEVEGRLQAILKSDHKHKTVKAYVECVECSAKREQRKQAMKKEGFKSLEQYFEWKKVIGIMKEIIKQRDESKKN